MNYFTTIILALVSFYVLLLAIVFLFQRNLLYHPSVNNYLKDKITNEPTEIEKVKITTMDNIDLVGWFYNKNIEKFKTILFFHGNAGSLENRTYKLNHFKNLNLNFLIIAWRGFSGNAGKANEVGLYNDAESAIKWLQSKGVTEQNIILYGESLGTGVAIEVAQNKNYAGIILESPYTSMVNVGKKYYSFFPVSLLLKDKFESYKKIKKVSVPVLVLHGKEDKIVPFSMGKKIYELANEPKFFYSQEYGDHMIDYDAGLLTTLKKFIQSLN
jgi:hypothetical protein|tara:strand:- start:1794 stop:2606 length:813 start_codon:yes stop_codon:yes gene_type:complete